MTEAEFQRQLVGPNGLATMLGWQHVHWRPAMQRKGKWETPGSGPLAKGWPDLTLARIRDQRLVFVELKGDGGTLSPDQERVLEVLRAAGQEVHVWWPRDIDRAAEVLR